MTLLRIILSDTTISLIVGLIPTVLGLWLKYKLDKMEKQNVSMEKKIDGRMDEILRLSRAESAAIGKAEGKAEEKAEHLEKSESIESTESSAIKIPLKEEVKVVGKIEGVIKPK